MIERLFWIGVGEERSLSPRWHNPTKPSKRKWFRESLIFMDYIVKRCICFERSKKLAAPLVITLIISCPSPPITLKLVYHFQEEYFRMSNIIATFSIGNSVNSMCDPLFNLLYRLKLLLCWLFNFLQIDQALNLFGRNSLEVAYLIKELIK